MFKELFTETISSETIEGFKKLKKSSAVVKNSAVVFGRSIYMEAKSTKQALRLSNSKTRDYILHSDDNIVGFGGGDASGFYDEYKRKILGNPDAKAYIEIKFKTEDIPKEYIDILGAKEFKGL